MIGGGSMLKVAEMAEDDVPNAETDGVKGEDQVSSILIPYGGRGTRTQLQETEETRLIYNSNKINMSNH